MLSAVVARRGCPIVLGAPLGDRRQPEIRLDVEDRVEPALLPLLEIVPLQQLALEVAVLCDQDPDRPDGLTKVTKTL